MGPFNRLTWLLSASLGFAAATSAAHAQQSPPPAEAPAAEEGVESDEIVILAQPGDQVRIDRRTYTLRDDATAQSTNMFDVLGRIPSVSVSPAGAITLLGASNVTIQINGQPVPGANLEQVLRGLPGANVERIEVITNPSAQYSAQASGGIINIITRQRFDSGFSGNLQAGADTLGGYHFGFAPSYAQGPWSFSGQIGVYNGGQENDLSRERRESPGGALTTETGARDMAWDGWYASRLTAGYSPNDRQRMSVALDGGEFNFEQNQLSEFADALGPVADRASHTSSTGEQRQLTFDFQQQGDQPRELMKLNVSLSQFVNLSENLYTETPVLGVASQYAAHAEQEDRGFDAKLDFEQPFEDERFLTYGLAFDSSNEDIENALETLVGVGPPDYQASLEGAQQTLAGYVTYQFDTGDWTWLPGLRAESYRREVISGGLETDDQETRFFPSIHIRRALTPAINIDLSYTSRIQRPGIQQLDPALRFIDVDRAVSGNPNLEPTTTDAYEANFVYQRNGVNFSVTFFDRISDDIVSQFTELNPDGVIVSTPVNAGTSEQRGLQVLWRGPIGERWRYSLSGNVLNREFDVLTSGGAITRRSEIEYDGTAQLDWRDPDQNAVGADQVQFELRFRGPRYGIQSESDPFVMANFTWRRRVTERLFAVVMVHDIFSSTDQISEITTTDYVERTEYSAAGARARVALTYQFGSGPQRPPQDQAPGGPPIMQ
ncbi:MAG: TonB-dependent receptor [Phycisphaerales bacterium]|nr:TonB-dependent receptor [Hyphomonadaceae bacterium]